MKANVNIDVEHVTRVEGHGNIKVAVKDGAVEDVRFEIVEAPRFFEAMLVGRDFCEAAPITSRICGICSIGHTLTSIKATEDAFGIEPSLQTRKLRFLLNDGEFIQSHTLHAYFLAAPDFLGAKSVFPLASSHREVVLRALKLKRLANDLCDLFGGRTIHPITPEVGGFSSLPKKAAVREMLDRLKDVEKDIDATVDTFASLGIPSFERETEYVSLKAKDHYALNEGEVYSSVTGVIPYREYRKLTNERIVDYSTAKHCKHVKDSYMVGAMARVNNNYDSLLPKAKSAAKALRLKLPCHNPFMITACQVVEIVHCWEDAVRLIGEFLTNGLVEEPVAVKVKPGTGIGAFEVPRGLLFHEYTYDDKGRITAANCIIPTGQNLVNIENDMRELVPKIVDRPREEIQLMLEMLVRAYDPCISCSTHMVKVEFK